MQATPTSKGQKTIPPQAWEDFAKGWNDPWPELSADEVMDDLRGRPD